jgi:hypothetical protein
MSSVSSASVFLVGLAGPVALLSPRTEVMRCSSPAVVLGFEEAGLVVVAESVGAGGEDAVGIG